MNKNEIFIRKNSKVFIPKMSDTKIDIVDNEAIVATIILNISSLGYTFTKKLYKKLILCDKKDIISFGHDIVKTLKKICYAHVKYDPMYPNFPNQVIEASDLELFLNAFMHYNTAFLYDVGIINENEIYMPKYKKQKRGVFDEKVKYKMIDIGNENEFKSIFTNLVSSKVSLSETDKEIIEFFFEKYYNDVFEMLPSEIEMKEQVILVCKLLMNNYARRDITIEKVSEYIKTPTDVLRFCVGLSNGDISLAENTRFRNFNRMERRYILSILNNCKTNIAQEMLTKKQQWLRLGEKLHPGEYKNLIRSFEAFWKIRNEKVHSFIGNVNIQLNKDFISGLNLLKTRPGELARRLDVLIRDNKDNSIDVINAFKSVVNNISTNVLLQLHCHFKNRNDNRELNIVFPKGSVAKSFVYDNNKVEIEKSKCKKIVDSIEKTLINRFKEKMKDENLNESFLSDNLKDIYIPFSNRSSSSSMLQLNRGSSISLEKDKNILRFFIHWKDISEPDNYDNIYQNRVDVDLSADFMNENFEYTGSVSYYNLKENGATHSGDITSAPKGAAEFIDIDLEKISKQNSDNAYIAMNVYSFTGQQFENINECFVGFMQREDANAGKIFEPKTIKNCIELKSKSKNVMPLLIDIKNRKVIWVDLPTASNRHSNSRNNSERFSKVCKSIVETKRPNVYDLLNLHIKANGNFVEEKKAKKIFNFENLNMDEITSKYL